MSLPPPTQTPHVQPDTPQEVREHINNLGEQLRATLRAVLTAVVGQPWRMSAIIDRLGLDKTLASRLSRATSAQSGLHTLLRGPGVVGYRLLIDRLVAIKTDPSGVEILNRCIDTLQAAYGLFPDGRRGFEAALAGWLPESQAKGARRARQQIYQATLFLMGVEVDVAYQCYAYMSAHAAQDACDLGYVEVRQDIHRARDSGPAILTGVPFVVPAPASSSNQSQQDQHRVECLDGTLPTNDATAALLQQFCSHPLNQCTTVPRNGSLLLVAPGNLPAVGQRLTTAMGVCGRNIVSLSKNPKLPETQPQYVYNSIVLRKPVRLMLIDVLVDSSLGLQNPQITLSAASGGGIMPTKPQEDDLAGMPMTETFMPLGSVSAQCLDPLVIRDVRNVPAMVKQLLSCAHAKNATYRAYRLIVEYPMPHSRHIVWMELAAATSPHSRASSSS